ncbi:JAB domain-containing protein [Roseibium alexandrii]
MAQIDRPQSPPAQQARDPSYQAKLKLLAKDADHLADHEVLEVLLGFALSPIDAQIAAKLLTAEFGNLAHCVKQPRHSLRKLGLSPEAIDSLHLLKACVVRQRRGVVKDLPMIDTHTKAVRYICDNWICDAPQWFRVLFLNKKNLLIHDEVFQEGILDFENDAAAGLVRRSLEHNACGLILAVRRPKSCPMPTFEEAFFFRELYDYTLPLGIEIADIVYIGKDNSLSAKHYINLKKFKEYEITSDDLDAVIAALESYKLAADQDVD